MTSNYVLFNWLQQFFNRSGALWQFSIFWHRYISLFSYTPPPLCAQAQSHTLPHTHSLALADSSGSFWLISSSSKPWVLCNWKYYILFTYTFIISLPVFGVKGPNNVLAEDWSSHFSHSSGEWHACSLWEVNKWLRIAQLIIAGMVLNS